MTLSLSSRFCSLYRKLGLIFPKNYSTDFSDVCPDAPPVALVVGVFSQNDGRYTDAAFTKSGEKYNAMTCNRLSQLLQASGPCPKLGEARVFFDIENTFKAVAVTGLGIQCAGYESLEAMDRGKENIRIAAAAGVRILSPSQYGKIALESFEHAESCAEGATLATFLYQDFKERKHRKIIPVLDMWDDCDWTGWRIGIEKGKSQNLARRLMESPANVMTPIDFSQNAVEILCPAGVNVEVKVRKWAEAKGMGAFLQVAKGSCVEPVFMEFSYYGAPCMKDRPIVLVGKGCTFDSGGINLEHPRLIQHARGDLQGAAAIVAAVRGVARLNLPINVRGLIPLCEHMPGSQAMKPGDIATALNGRHIFIQDTRCEGRLMLADALTYAQSYWPQFIVDVGSMTRGARSALSTAASAVFTNSENLWKSLRIASVHTGDRMWRFPLFKHYTKKMTLSSSVDLKNYGRRKFGGDPCRCAAFLKEFVPCGEWMHIDCFGTMYSCRDSDPPYLGHGMSGRPTRTLIEFMSQLCCED